MLKNSSHLSSAVQGPRGLHSVFDGPEGSQKLVQSSQGCLIITISLLCVCKGFLFLPNIVFWPSFAKVGHHSSEQLLTQASHQALGFCLSHIIVWRHITLWGVFPYSALYKKGHLCHQHVPLFTLHIWQGSKEAEYFSEIAKLLKIQYLMWKCSRQFVQPLLQERSLLAWHSQPAWGLGKNIEHFCPFVRIHTDKQLPEGMKILEWREEAKRKNWGSCCGRNHCGCTVEEILQAM